MSIQAPGRWCQNLNSSDSGSSPSPFCSPLNYSQKSCSKCKWNPPAPLGRFQTGDDSAEIEVAARDEQTGGNADLESHVEPMQTVQDVQQGASVQSSPLLLRQDP